jgi:hypothetical protein
MWVFYAHKNPNLLNQKSHDCELDQSEASITLNPGVDPRFTITPRVIFKRPRSDEARERVDDEVPLPELGRAITSAPPLSTGRRQHPRVFSLRVPPDLTRKPAAGGDA